MSEEYPLTLEHVKQFLATKQDNDLLGICHNSMYCLLSEVLGWLYPEMAPWRVGLISYGTAKGNMYYMPQVDILELHIAFDACSSYFSHQGPISKALFREYLYRIEKLDNLKFPFPVSALFEEGQLV